MKFFRKFKMICGINLKFTISKFKVFTHYETYQVQRQTVTTGHTGKTG